MACALLSVKSSLRESRVPTGARQRERAFNESPDPDDSMRVAGPHGCRSARRPGNEAERRGRVPGGGALRDHLRREAHPHVAAAAAAAALLRSAAASQGHLNRAKASYFRQFAEG